MFTASLSQIVCIWLASVAYIESVTDATNDVEQTENKCVKSEKYLYNKFFSASAFLSSLTISAESTAWWPNS